MSRADAHPLRRPLASLDSHRYVGRIMGAHLCDRRAVTPLGPKTTDIVSHISVTHSGVMLPRSRTDLGEVTRWTGRETEESRTRSAGSFAALRQGPPRAESLSKSCSAVHKARIYAISNLLLPSSLPTRNRANAGPLHLRLYLSEMVTEGGRWRGRMFDKSGLWAVIETTVLTSGKSSLGLAKRDKNTKHKRTAIPPGIVVDGHAGNCCRPVASR